MANKSGIHIKPSKKGTFTAAAKKRGMGVQAFASKVMANKEDYSPAMVKKANFARNAAKWKREDGGDIMPLYTQQTMEPGGKMPKAYAQARFRAAGNEDLLGEYGYAKYGADIEPFVYHGYNDTRGNWHDPGLDKKWAAEAGGELMPLPGDFYPMGEDTMPLPGKFPTPNEDMQPLPEKAGGGGIPQRYKNMGFSRVGQKKAGSGKHKWKVLAKKGDQYKVVQGGWRGMQDFKQHGSEKRRDKFWSRMGGKNSAKAKDPFSPLYWHKRFGTWEAGGMINQMEDGGNIPDNPGFRALPEAVQQKIIDNMEAGGKMPLAYARARFEAAGNEDMLKDYGYAKSGGNIPNNPGFKALPPYVQQKILGKAKKAQASTTMPATYPGIDWEDAQYKLEGYMPLFMEDGETGMNRPISPELLRLQKPILPEIGSPASTITGIQDQRDLNRIMRGGASGITEEQAMGLGAPMMEEQMEPTPKSFQQEAIDRGVVDINRRGADTDFERATQQRYDTNRAFEKRYDKSLLKLQDPKYQKWYEQKWGKKKDGPNYLVAGLSLLDSFIRDQQPRYYARPEYQPYYNPYPLGTGSQAISQAGGTYVSGTGIKFQASGNISREDRKRQQEEGMQRAKERRPYLRAFYDKNPITTFTDDPEAQAAYSQELAESMESGRQWLQNWYEKRAQLPQFKTVAGARAMNLSKAQPYFMVPENLMEPNTAASTLPQNIQVPLMFAGYGENPSYTAPYVAQHEMTHRQDVMFPQLFLGKKGRERREMLEMPTSEQTGMDMSKLQWLEGDVEPNAVLSWWRKENKIDPTKQITADEVSKIMEYYQNLPSREGITEEQKKESWKNRKEYQKAHGDYHIKALWDRFGRDPQKFADYHNTTVMNRPIMQEEIMAASGAMIKRKDGSYSRRGLWDNIRANRGSGKKPTAEMLRQERKIKAKEAEAGMQIMDLPMIEQDMMAKAGKMIKRADGSYSRRGLWDNIRAAAARNKRTGAKPKKPTSEMLRQERRIKAKEAEAGMGVTGLYYPRGGEIMNVGDMDNPIARMGGNLRRNYVSEYEQGGELELYDDRAGAQPISDNPVSDGPVVEFKGPTHKEGGIPMSWYDNPVEVEGGETGHVDKLGNFQIGGNLLNPLTGRKFKRDMKEIAKKENKYTKKYTDAAMKMANIDMDNPYENLAGQSFMAKMKGAQEELTNLDALKEYLSELQQGKLALADELGIEAMDLDGIEEPISRVRTAQASKSVKPAVDEEMENYEVDVDAMNARAKAQRDEYEMENYEIDEDALRKRSGLPPLKKGEKPSKNPRGRATRKGGPPSVRKKEDGEGGGGGGETETKPYTYLGPPQVLRRNEPEQPKKTLEVPPRVQLKSNVQPFDWANTYPEFYALATNRVEPVFMQKYIPRLKMPFQYSFQDQLNANNASFRAALPYVRNNPSLQAGLVAQKYSADSGVLSNEFRVNQQEAASVYNENLDRTNQAQMLNLQIADQAAQRAAMARANTRKRAFDALQSISQKRLLHQKDMNELAVLENLYQFRYDQDYMAKYAGRPVNFENMDFGPQYVPPTQQGFIEPVKPTNIGSGAAAASTSKKTGKAGASIGSIIRQFKKNKY